MSTRHLETEAGLTTLKFEDTALVKEKGNLQLRSRDGELLFELKSRDIDDAIHCGFLDPGSPHFSLFEHVRMIREVSHGGSVIDQETDDSEADIQDPPEDDETFLNRLGISSD